LQTGTSVDLMPKSPDAFRTISEVADWLGIQAHVLRFWESKFTQVKPIKRAGGRRYYRPADMLLLGGIKRMLHDDGLTIKGVQKVLREEGMNHVSALSAPLDELSQTDFDDNDLEAIDMVAIEPKQPESVVLPFEAARSTGPKDMQEPELSEDRGPESALQEGQPEQVDPFPAPETPTPAMPAPDASESPPFKPSDVTEPVPEPAPPQEPIESTAQPSETEEVISEASEPDISETHSVSEDTALPEPIKATPDETLAEDDSSVEDLPAFLREPLSDPEAEQSDNIPIAQPTDAKPQAKPRIIDVPTQIDEATIPALPGALSAALNAKSCTSETAKDLAPLLARLAALRDSMSSGRKPAAKD